MVIRWSISYESWNDLRNDAPCSVSNLTMSCMTCIMWLLCVIVGLCFCSPLSAACPTGQLGCASMLLPRARLLASRGQASVRVSKLTCRGGSNAFHQAFPTINSKSEKSRDRERSARVTRLSTQQSRISLSTIENQNEINHDPAELRNLAPMSEAKMSPSDQRTTNLAKMTNTQ